MHETLPVKENLKARNITTAALFPHCGEAKPSLICSTSAILQHRFGTKRPSKTNSPQSGSQVFEWDWKPQSDI